MYISTARLGGLREDGFYGAPDLIVEVVSSRPALDRLLKRDKYGRAGVPHYWIVDPARRTLEEYLLEGDRYALPRELSGAEVFQPVLFPGLSIELQDLWL